MDNLIAGPSAGVLGDNRGVVDRELFEKHPDWARELVTIGRYPRAGHDRERWKTVDWDAYRARVGVGGSAGPWFIMPVESKAGDDVTRWVTDAEGLPPAAPGWYTSLRHAERGLVMSDIPAETCGSLAFTDYAESIPGARVLIAGLGLGIVPARLLRYGDLASIDVIEIDADVIRLVTEDAAEEGAPNDWAADPRLGIHHADAFTWRAPRGRRYDAAWFDVWDTVSAANLPSMRELHRRYARRVARGRMWSWERAECEAMARRGQVIPRSCITLGGSKRTCTVSPGEEEW